jgi:hypothetical protein
MNSLGSLHFEKEKEEREAQWRVKRNAFESSIHELQRTIRGLEQEIKGLASITAAEKEMKSHKGRRSQERKFQQDLKERRLSLQKAQLQEKESDMKQAKEKIDAADLRNDTAIRLIEAKIEARARSKDFHERRQRENAQRERRAHLFWQQQQEQREKDAKIRQQQRQYQEEQAKYRQKQQQYQEEQAKYRQQQQQYREEQVRIRRQQQEQREKAATELFMKQQAAEELARQEEYRPQEPLWESPVLSDSNYNSTRQPHASATCDHNGWWDKLVHRTPCPECHDVWNYLLRCPGCEMEACPKCQSDIRPPYQRPTARMTQRDAPRPRSPSPYRGWNALYD